MNELYNDSYDRRYNFAFTNLISKFHQLLKNGSRLLVILRGASGSGKSTLAKYC